MSSSPVRSSTSSTSDSPDKWDWEKLYDYLERLIKSLKMPGQDTASFHAAIRSARIVETKAVILYAKASRYLASARKNVSDAKFEYSTKLKQLLSDPHMNGLSQRRYREKCEASLVEEQHALDLAVDSLTRLTVFTDCVDRVLSNTRHHREDLSKRIKILEVEYGIGED